MPGAGRRSAPGDEPWTAVRLKQVLHHKFSGKRLVVVSNREPLIHQWRGDRIATEHDGMNLVAKEFIAARDDEEGVLLLSRFAGASRELTAALVVNPYDVDGVADTLLAALMMPRVEQRVPMRALRAVISACNAYAWAGRMLVDASRSRWREALPDRLPADGRPAVPAAV